MKKMKIIIVGAGGFGQEVIWAIINSNANHPRFDILGYCDDTPKKQGLNIYGYPVLGTPEAVDQSLPEKPYFLCAIGSNKDRAQVVARVLSLGWKPATVIDPSVIAAAYVEVGEGTYIGAGTILSPYACIGNHVIINTGCTIGHDSVLEDFVQVSPGGRVSGSAYLEEGVFIASNAVVAPKIRIGRYATLGACSFAATNIPKDVTAIGNPARVVIGKRQERNLKINSEE